MGVSGGVYTSGVRAPLNCHIFKALHSSTHTHSSKSLFQRLSEILEDVGHDEAEERHEFQQVVLEWGASEQQSPASLHGGRGTQNNRD